MFFENAFFVICTMLDLKVARNWQPTILAYAIIFLYQIFPYKRVFLYTLGVILPSFTITMLCPCFISRMLIDDIFVVIFHHSVLLISRGKTNFSLLTPFSGYAATGFL